MNYKKLNEFLKVASWLWILLSLTLLLSMTYSLRSSPELWHFAYGEASKPVSVYSNVPLFSPELLKSFNITPVNDSVYFVPYVNETTWVDDIDNLKTYQNIFWWYNGPIGFWILYTILLFAARLWVANRKLRDYENI